MAIDPITGLEENEDEISSRIDLMTGLSEENGEEYGAEIQPTASVAASPQLIQSSSTPTELVNLAGEDYIPEESDNFAQLIEREKAKDQGIFELLYNTVVGGTLTGILGTAIETGGWILDFDNHLKGLQGYDTWEKAWYTEMAHKIKESVGKEGDEWYSGWLTNLPIYREDRGDMFDWDDPGWYAESAKGILDSVIGFGIPGLGAAKAVTLFNKATRLSQLMRAASKSGKLEGVVTSLGAGLLTNYGEGKVMGMEIHDDIMEYGKEAGWSEEKSRELAGESADQFLFSNRIFMLTDALGIHGIMKGAGYTRNAYKAGGFKAGAKNFLQSFKKFGIENPLLQGIKEAGEEMGQFGFQEAGRVGAKEKLGMDVSDEPESYLERALLHAFDEQARYEGMLGFFSGGPQRIFMSQMQKAGTAALPKKWGGAGYKTQKQRQKQRYQQQEALVKEAQKVVGDFVTRKGEMAETLAYFKSVGDDAMVEAIENHEFAQTATGFFQNGVAEHLEKQLQDIIDSTNLTEEQVKLYGEEGKQKAKKFLGDLKTLEKEWISLKGYENQGRLFWNLQRQKAQKRYEQIHSESNSKYKTSLLDQANRIANSYKYKDKEGEEKTLEFDIDDIDNTKGQPGKIYKKFADEVKKLPDYKNYIFTKGLIKSASDNILALTRQYSAMESDKGQEKHIETLKEQQEFWSNQAKLYSETTQSEETPQEGDLVEIDRTIGVFKGKKENKDRDTVLEVEIGGKTKYFVDDEENPMIKRIDTKQQKENDEDAEKGEAPINAQRPSNSRTMSAKELQEQALQEEIENFMAKVETGAIEIDENGSPVNLTAEEAEFYRNNKKAIDAKINPQKTVDTGGIKPEFKGKFIYSTPGSGKSTIAKNIDGVVDMDDILHHLLVQVEGFENVPNDKSLNENLYNLFKIDDGKTARKLYEQAVQAARALTSQGHVVLTGSSRLLEDVDVIVVSSDNEGLKTATKGNWKTTRERESKVDPDHTIEEDKFLDSVLMEQVEDEEGGEVEKKMSDEEWYEGETIADLIARVGKKQALSNLKKVHKAFTAALEELGKTHKTITEEEEKHKYNARALSLLEQIEEISKAIKELENASKAPQDNNKQTDETINKGPRTFGPQPTKKSTDLPTSFESKQAFHLAYVSSNDPLHPGSAKDGFYNEVLTKLLEDPDWKAAGVRVVYEVDLPKEDTPTMKAFMVKNKEKVKGLTNKVINKEKITDEEAGRLTIRVVFLNEDGTEMKKDGEIVRAWLHDSEHPMITRNESKEEIQGLKQFIYNHYREGNKVGGSLLGYSHPGHLKGGPNYKTDAGTNTASGNVKIIPKYGPAGIAYAKANNAIYSLRRKNTQNHFGNPFVSLTDDQGKKRNQENYEKTAQEGELVWVDSGEESVKNYREWLTTDKYDGQSEAWDKRKKWILAQIASGKLKGKTIMYYKELGRLSHANVLDELINGEIDRRQSPEFIPVIEALGTTNLELAIRDETGALVSGYKKDSKQKVIIEKLRHAADPNKLIGGVYTPVQMSDGSWLPHRLQASTLTAEEAELIYMLYANLFSGANYGDNISPGVIKFITEHKNPVINGLAKVFDLNDTNYDQLRDFFLLSGRKRFDKTNPKTSIFFSPHGNQINYAGFIKEGKVAYNYMNKQNFQQKDVKKRFIDNLMLRTRNITLSTINKKGTNAHLLGNGLLLSDLRAPEGPSTVSYQPTVALNSNVSVEGSKTSKPPVSTEKAPILTVYQGIKGKKENRDFNYYTLSKEEAKTYGEVSEYQINTAGFLTGNTDLYWELMNEFEEDSGKRFDILDSTPGGLKHQAKFFTFLKEKGYKGLNLIPEGAKPGVGENQYIVTFFPALSTKQRDNLVYLTMSSNSYEDAKKRHEAGQDPTKKEIDEGKQLFDLLTEEEKNIIGSGEASMEFWEKLNADIGPRFEQQPTAPGTQTKIDFDTNLPDTPSNDENPFQKQIPYVENIANPAQKRDYESYMPDGETESIAVEKVLKKIKEQSTDPFLLEMIKFLEDKRFDVFSEFPLLMYTRNSEEIAAINNLLKANPEVNAKTIEKLKKHVPAYYDTDRNHIVINKDTLPYMTLNEIHKTIVHEVWHAVTAVPFTKKRADRNAAEREFVDAIAGLYRIFKDKKFDFKRAQETYGFKTPHEFMAEVMSNQYFRDEIAKEYPPNFLQRMWNAIMKFLKLPSRQIGMLFKIENTIKKFVDKSQKFPPQVQSELTKRIILKKILSPADRPLNHYSDDDLEEITGAMTYILIDAAKITDLDSIKNIKTQFKEDENGHNKIFRVLNNIRIGHNNSGNQDMAQKFANILSQEEFPYFMERVKNNLAEYGLRERLSKQEEEDKAAGLGITPSWETNLKDNATSNTKLRVAFNPIVAEVTEEEGKRTYKYEKGQYLGLFKFGDFNETWKILQKELSGIVSTNKERDVMKKMRNRLNWLAFYDKSLYKLVDFFDDQSISNFKKVQFHNAFSKTRLAYTSTFFRRVEDGTYSFNIGSSDSASAENRLLATWEDNFLFKYTKADNDQILHLNIPKLQKVYDKYLQVKEEIRQIGKKMETNPDAYTYEDLTKELDKLSEVLQETGMQISTKALTLFIRENFDENFGTGLLHLITEPLARVYDSNTGNTVKRLLNGSAVFAYQQEDSAYTDYNTPMAKEPKFNTLLPSVLFFSKDNYENMILGQKGSKYWLYSHHDFITKSVAEWLEESDNPEKLQQLASLPFYQNSRLVQELISSPDKLKNFKLHHYNNFKDTEDPSKDDGYTEMKKPDDRADRYNRTMRGTAPFMNTADKSRHLNFSGVGFKKTKILFQEDGSYDFQSNTTAKQSVEQVIGYLIDEINATRVAFSQLFSEDPIPRSEHVVYYHYQLDSNTGERIYKDKNGFPVGNAFKFYTFPELNYYNEKGEVSNSADIFMEATPGKPYVINEEYIRTEINEETNKETLIVEPSFFDKIRPIAEKSLSERVTNAVDKGIEDGIITTQVIDGGMVKIDTGRLEDIVIDSNEYSKLEYAKLYQASEQEALRNLMMDITFNSIVNNIELTKLFIGDPRFYKNLADVKKRIPATIANGQDLAIYRDMNNEWVVPPHYTQATVANVIRPSEYYGQEGYADLIAEVTGSTVAEAEQLIEAYKEVNVTDAQAWITLDRAIQIYKGLGKWTDAHDAALPAIIDGTADFQELSLFLQPIKGVHYELRIENGMAIPSYSKYSQAILLPSLIKGTHLENLLEAMQNEDQLTDEVIVLDGVKVGATDIANWFNKDTYDINAAEDIVLHPVTLDNRYWKLQQDLSPHGLGPSLVGSQVKKTMTANIALDDDYGDGWTGRDVIRAAYDVDMTLSNRGRDFLLKELVYDENTGKISKDKIYELILEESKTDPFFYREALEERIDFDALPQYVKKIESRLSALVTARTTKLKQLGGAYVQVSNFGFDIKESTKLPDNIKQGIKWLKGKEPLKPMRIEKDEVKPGQFLLPHKMLKEIEGWENMTGEEIAKKIDPEVLIAIGYRIPNQANSSNDVGEIVGFLPEAVGDAVVVYNEITTKTGSDFDIDKMFMMLPEYEKDENGNIVKVQYLDESNSTLKERIKVFAPTTPEAAMIRKSYRKEFEDLYERRKQHRDKQTQKINALKEKKKLQEQDIDELWSTEQEERDYIKTLKAELKELRKEKKHLGTSASESKEYKTVSGNITNIEEEIAERYAILKGYEDLRASIGETKLKKTDVDKEYETKSEQIRLFKEEKQALKDKMQEEIEAIIDEEKFARLPMLEQNTDLALHNRRIDVWRRILLNKNKYLEVTAPLDGPGTITEQVKNQIKELFPEKALGNLEFFSLENQLEDKHSFLGGKFGIGVTANQLVDHSLTQFSKQFLKLKLGIGHADEDGYMDLSQLYDVDHSTGETKNLIIGAIAAYLNAYVDIAKDNYITRGNHNLITANTVFMLLRAGVPFKFVNAFIAQPILQAYVQLTEKDQATVTEREFDQEGRNVSVLRQTLNLFGGQMYNRDDLPTLNLAETTTEQLERAINTTAALPKTEGGFDPKGKGTPEGDGKDKAMREVATGSIVELLTDKKPSSSLTTLETVGKESSLSYEKDRYVGETYDRMEDIEGEIGHTIIHGPVVMLARNGELGGRDLNEETKWTIERAHKRGSSFVVGDMPGVDTAFIEHLQKIGADFTVYHTGETIRPGAIPMTTAGISQLQVLGTFIELREAAKKLSDSVMASKADTKGAGKNLIESFIMTNKLEKISADPDKFIGNWEEKLNNTPLGTYVKNGPVLAQELFEDFFLSQSQGAKDMMNAINIRLEGEVITDDIFADKISAEIYAGIMSKEFSLTTKEKETLLYGENTIADRLRILQDTDHPSSKHDLITLLKWGRKYKRIPAFIGINNYKDTDLATQDRVSKSWEKMYFLGTEEEKKFAEDLVYYSYLTSGFKRTRSSFYTLIPPTVLSDMGLVDAIIETKIELKRGIGHIGALEDQIFKHNWEDTDYVPRVPDRLATQITWEGTTLPTNAMFGVMPGVANHLVVGRDAENNHIMKPYLLKSFHFRDQQQNDRVVRNLYEFVGMAPQTAERKDGSTHEYDVAVYIRTNKLGYQDERGRKVIEYNLDKDGTVSEIERNNPDLSDDQNFIDNFVRDAVKVPGELVSLSSYLANRESDVHRGPTDDEIDDNLNRCN